MEKILSVDGKRPFKTFIHAFIRPLHSAIAGFIFDFFELQSRVYTPLNRWSDDMNDSRFTRTTASAAETQDADGQKR